MASFNPNIGSVYYAFPADTVFYTDTYYSDQPTCTATPLVEATPIAQAVPIPQASLLGGRRVSYPTSQQTTPFSVYSSSIPPYSQNLYFNSIPRSRRISSDPSPIAQFLKGVFVVMGGYILLSALNSRPFPNHTFFNRC